MSTAEGGISKASRAALRAALKSQLAVVRKKVRTMRAKALIGEKDEDSKPDEKKEIKHVATGVADRKSGGGSDPGDSQGRGAGSEAEGQKGLRVSGGEGEDGELSPDLKADALAFFQKGNKPKVGSTRSVIAQVMTNEQRSFTRDSRHHPKPQAKGGKRK